MATDPVCGKPISPHQAGGGMIWYKGAPYYFCGADCHDKFDLHPAVYASHGPVVPGVPRGA